MNNSALLFILVLIGLLLITPEAWYLFSNSIRAGDLRVAFQNLAKVPASQVRQQHSVNLGITIPNNAAWKRIRRSWGDPAYEIALISSVGEYQYCLDGISIAAMKGDAPIALEEAESMYGFSSAASPAGECKSAGPGFHAAPGSRIQVNLVSDGELASGDKIVVRPVWPYTKDKLLGVELDEDFRPIAIGLAVIGLLIAVGAGITLRTVMQMDRTKVPA
jgi:hypothetical protein